MNAVSQFRTKPLPSPFSENNNERLVVDRLLNPPISALAFVILAVGYPSTSCATLASGRQKSSGPLIIGYRYFTNSYLVCQYLREISLSIGDPSNHDSGEDWLESLSERNGDAGQETERTGKREFTLEEPGGAATIGGG